MPIYDYSCEACGKPFEHFARTISEAPPACPACGSHTVGKQFSAFSTSTSSPSAVSAACSSCPGSALGCRPSGHRHGAGCGHC